MKRSRILSLILAVCLLIGMMPGLVLTGTAATEKEVARVYGQTRYETAFQLADWMKYVMGVEKFSNIVVASGTNFADALGGSYLASVKEAPILLVQESNAETVKDYIRANLQPGGTVYLLGGTAAVPASMETGLDGFTVKRLGGADRYETNLRILYETEVFAENIVVCTGKNYADSLSASALGRPILLVKDTVTEAQKDFLRTTYGDKIIIGGYSAVSKDAERGVSVSASRFSDVLRISGADRYETSVLVALWFFDNPKGIFMAYGKNFPDGLCTGPLAYFGKYPLILSANGQEDSARAYVKQQNVQEAFVIGGPSLISDESALKTVKDYAGTTGSNVLPDMSAFLNREPNNGKGSPEYYKKIPDNLSDTVAAEMLALLQQDKYQLELVGVRTSESDWTVFTEYCFLYVGDAEGTDLESSDAYEEKIFSVGLEIRDNKEAGEPTSIYYKFGDGFTLEDPGSRVSVNLPDPNENSNNNSSSGDSDCLSCRGSGRCSSCGGSGEVKKWVAGTTHDYVMQDCTSCSGGSCGWCYGSGKA